MVSSSRERKVSYTSTTRYRQEGLPLKWLDTEGGRKSVTSTGDPEDGIEDE